MFNVNVNCGSIKGYYGIAVKDIDGNIVPEKTIERSDNIVTNYGLGQCLGRTDSGIFAADTVVRVGTGTTEITATDTSLGTDITPRIVNTGSKSGNPSTYLISDNGDGTSTYLFSHVGSFNVGDFDGDVLSEVGLHYTSAANTLVAGQLIKDSGGTPTTITVLSTEQLTVTYSFEVTVPNQKFQVGTGTVDVDGTNYNYTLYCPKFFYNNNVSDTNFEKGQPNLFTYTCNLHNSSGGVIARTGGNARKDFTNTGVGTGTLEIDDKVVPPGQGESPVKYITFGTTDNSGSINFADDEWFQAVLLLEFDTEVTKPSGFSLTVGCEIDVSMTRA